MKPIYKYIYSILIFVFISSIAFAQKENKTKSTKYDFQGAYFNGLARIKQNHKWGFVNKDGKEVVKPKYNEEENFSDGLARVRRERKWGLVDTTGTEIVTPMFDWIYDFENGKAKVTLMGQEAYINRQGQKVNK